MLKGKDQWNIPELLHAIVIMCYYHSWSCFIFSNGIRLEHDMGYYCEKEGKFITKRSFDDKTVFLPSFTFESSILKFLDIRQIIDFQRKRRYYNHPKEA